MDSTTISHSSTDTIAFEACSRRTNDASHPSSLRPADYLHWNCLWLALFFIGIGILLFATPKTLDDYWFIKDLQDWYASQGFIVPSEDANVFSSGFPMEGIIKTWDYRIKTDNSRLGNILVTTLLIFTKWVGMIFPFLAFILTVLVGFKLVNINWRTSPIVALAIFLWMFFYPWRDGFTSVVFAFNYAIPSGLALWLIYILFNKKQADKWVGILILSFLIGWWHEGFAVPLIIGLLSLVILFRRFRNKYIYIAIAALLIGLFFIILPGSFRNRVATTVNLRTITEHIFPVLAINFLYFIFLCWCAILQIKKRKVFGNPLLIFLLVCGFIPILLMLITYVQSRIATLSILCSILGILYLTNKINPPRRKVSRALALSARIILLGLSFIHLATVDYYAIKIHNSFYKGVDEYNKNPYRQIFGEIWSVDRLPIITLNLPDPLTFNTTPQIIFNAYKGHYGNPPDKTFYIVPEELKDYTEKKGIKLNGNFGARLYEGRIVARADSIELEYPGLLQYEGYYFDFGEGFVHKPTAFYEFKSQADGNTYFFILPFSSWVEKHFRDVKGVRHQKAE